VLIEQVYDYLKSEVPQTCARRYSEVSNSGNEESDQPVDFKIGVNTESRQ
jgi:hypothetical protein